MIAEILAGVTSLHMGFADLPKTAYSYDGEARDISHFYEPSFPTTTVGYAYDTSKDSWIDGYNSSGYYTDKLDKNPTINAVYNHVWSIAENTNLIGSVGTTMDLGMNHRPCTDSYNRQYYCANLTAFSDLERKNDVQFNSQIGISINFGW